MRVCGTDQGARLGGVWERRSRLEQVLVALFSCSLIVIFALSIAVGVRKKNQEKVDVFYDFRVNYSCPNASEFIVIPLGDFSDTPDVNVSCNCPNITTSHASYSNGHSANVSTHLTTGNVKCEPPNTTKPARVIRYNETDHEELCTSQSCVIAAADLFNSMDETLDPCDDFYDYACKAWVDETTIIDRVSDRFSALSDKMTLKLKDLLEEENTDNPHHFEKARKFYEACTNWTGRENEGLTPFLNDLKYFGGFPVLMGDAWNASKFDYMTVMSRMLNRGYDNGILLSISLEKDMKNNSFERIVIHQTHPGMNNRLLFKDTTAMLIYDTYTRLYAEYLCADENSNCTVSHERIKTEIDEAIGFEKNITDMLYSADYLADNEKIYNIMTINNLSHMAHEINWLKLISIYFPNITITGDTEIQVTVPGFMQNFSSLINSTIKSPEGRRKLANYMSYRQVKDATSHLSRDIKRAYYDFQGQLKGNIKIPDLWSECVGFTAAVFDLSLGAQYIKKFFPKERKKAIEDLVEKIKVELKNILEHTTWMDEITKERALRKLRYIYLMAVYPDGLLNDTKLDEWYKKIEVGDSHYENYVQSNLFLYEKEVEGFGSPVDRANWRYLPSSILESNAYYSGSNNSVFVPLGISQSWFFEEKGPLYVNYGRMGFVLAHELSHAFDVKGAELDENGNWENWWQNETLAQFKNHSKCMINLFNGYYSKAANLTLNGSRTITENTADDIGIAEVYAAFKKTNEKNPAPTLPGHNLTAKQLFWVNYASIWCEKDTNEYYVDLITTDVHPPSRYRVISPLSNNKDFISDFKCKAGDKMFRNGTHCHVWGVEPNSM